MARVTIRLFSAYIYSFLLMMGKAEQLILPYGRKLKTLPYGRKYISF